MRLFINSIMRPRVLATACATALVLGTVNTAVAHSDHQAVKAEHRYGKHHNHGFRKGMLKKMARKLGLDEAQRQQIKTIMSNAKQERSIHQASMESYREQVKVLMSAAQFDEAAFLSLRQQYSSSFDQAALAKAKTRFAISQVLTAEQRAKWQELKSQRQAKKLARKAKRQAEKAAD